jgi:hypothetical protein
MANWCYNTVTFTGEPDVINSLTCFLYELAQEGRRTGHGQLPDFITRKEGWMFELGWSGEFCFYTTKWKPNTNVLIEVADRYGLDFRHEYEETGNRIFGVSAYEDGVLRTTDLDTEDFEVYCYNETTETYEFENEYYESSDEILQILLERKSAIQILTT